MPGSLLMSFLDFGFGWSSVIRVAQLCRMQRHSVLSSQTSFSERRLVSAIALLQVSATAAIGTFLYARTFFSLSLPTIATPEIFLMPRNWSRTANRFEILLGQSSETVGSSSKHRKLFGNDWLSPIDSRLPRTKHKQTGTLLPGFGERISVPEPP